jgi:Na+/H+-dicarboxylate symporter
MSVVGNVFLRLLKMLVVPLVLTSIVAGIASLGSPRQLGRTGLLTVGYFLATTAVAVTIGLTAATVLRPGDAMPEQTRAELAESVAVNVDQAELPRPAEQFLRMVPDNPVTALADGDMLPIIFFSVLFGIALGLLPRDKSNPVVAVVDGTAEAMVRLVHMVMLTAPLGVGAIMMTVTATSGLSVLWSLAAYGGVVVLALALHLALCHLPAVRFLAGVPVGRFLNAARPTMLLTFGTSSSSAALPVTLECAEEGLGIPKHVARLVVPVGATVNMDGTALYQGVATVFIAQLYGLDLSGGALVQLVTMATLASIGAAGVPGAGMVTLTMVLTSLGLPLEGVAIILGLDRILDMFRSAVNVVGDLSCATVVSHFSSPSR